ERIYAERRFEDANVLINAYERDHGKTEIGLAAVPKLREDLLERGKALVASVRRQARDEAAARRWEAARNLLRDLLPGLRAVPAPGDLVNAETASRNAGEQRARDSAIEQRDEQLKKAADEAARAHAEQREYDGAARVLQDASGRIHSDALRKELDRHAV